MVSEAVVSPQIHSSPQRGGERNMFALVTVAILVSTSLLGLLTTNPLLTPISLLLLPVIAYLTWRKGEPPALTFACAFQWLQAAAAVFYTDFIGASLAAAFGGIELEKASWLSLCGVMALASGVWLGLLRAGRSRAADIAYEGGAIDLGKAFTAYIISFFISFALIIAAGRLPSLSQPLLAAGTLKWVFIFMIGFCVLEQRRGYIFLGFVVALEFSVGILGFFAGFKSVFYVLFVALVTSSLAFRGRRLFLLAGIAALLIVFGSIWTAVKSDYREFLNQGFQSQEVLVPVEERVGKLQDLLSGFGAQEFADGFATMILRVSYVQFFALTMKNVPENVPYENGALWLEAIKHVLTPRLLFPDKAPIDDSARTSLYTGLDVAGAEQGTSIGIGYFGESYIDFGPFFMFVPILLVGLWYGLMYRLFVIRARYKLLGGAIVTSILVFNGSAIETANMKVLGGGINVLLVMSVFYLVAGPALMRWLTVWRGQ